MAARTASGSSADLVGRGLVEVAARGRVGAPGRAAEHARSLGRPIPRLGTRPRRGATGLNGSEHDVAITASTTAADVRRPHLASPRLADITTDPLPRRETRSEGDMSSPDRRPGGGGAPSSRGRNARRTRRGGRPRRHRHDRPSTRERGVHRDHGRDRPGVHLVRRRSRRAGRRVHRRRDAGVHRRRRPQGPRRGRSRHVGAVADRRPWRRRPRRAVGHLRLRRAGDRRDQRPGHRRRARARPRCAT